MNFFRKRKPEKSSQPPKPVFSAGLPQAGDKLPVSLLAYSRFIKRVNCSQCGAPKTLPSKTAYLYCDYCGSLMDYDFRLGNAGTNAGLSNTVYHRIFATVQAPMAQARARGDREEVRRIYTQWLQECPIAVSPRAAHDMEFREQFIQYTVECAVTKDFDPRQAGIEAQIQTVLASLQRIPMPGGAWRTGGPFWEYATLYKQQMEMAYALIHEQGIDALDPDHAPEGVPLRMEYSYFYQAWLPHLAPEDGERLLKLYGLDGEYDEVRPQQTNGFHCGGCGSELQALTGAHRVVCESCGFTIDVESQPVPCRKCGALLSYPVSADHLACPYCRTDNRRV
jgi:LSD1 subclass zinc finger protein